MEPIPPPTAAVPRPGPPAARRLGDLLEVPPRPDVRSRVVRPRDVGGRAAWSVLVRDGVLEVVRRDEDAAVVAGTPTGPATRAGLLRARVPSGAVVAARTAAWVHAGPAADDGGRLDLTYRAGGHRPAVWGQGLCWQSPLLADDVVDLAGVRVTDPVRTAVDLALHVVPADDAARRVGTLVRVCGIELADVGRRLERRVRAVGRPRARDVLRAVADDLL